MSVTRPMDWNTTSSDDLCRLCIDVGHVEAWDEFVRRFRKPIVLAAARVARLWGRRGSAEIDDIAQETFVRICADRCRLLRNFVGSPEKPDALSALVRVVAGNVAHDFFRNQSAAKRGGAAPGVPPEMPEDEDLSDLWRGAGGVEREVQMRELERALEDRSVSAISARDRLIFRLYFIEGQTAAAIADIPAMQLTTKGVESALHRVACYLRLRLNPTPTDLIRGTDREGRTPQLPMKGADK